MRGGPIVGRRAELAVLDDALADTRAGRGGVVLLVGEPGIGKSRLAEEVARRATTFEVVWGRAWEAGGAPPYWPWAQVLRALGGEATLRGDAAPATAEDRFLVFDAATRHLLAAAGARPLLVILEDLHAADEPTLHLLAFAATQLRGAPVLVLGTYRDVEARLTAAAGAVLDRIARNAQVIHPRRLEREDVVAIAADMGLDAEAIAVVHRRSEGNPLFVVELLRVIARRGAGDTSVPASVRTAIREHLRGLPASLPPVLEAAAVIGRELTLTVVADVCQRPLADVRDVLSTAVELGVLVERGVGVFAFAHGLIAETLHDDLPAVRRAALHLAVADALEREPAPPLMEIAHHLIDAAQYERAAEVALRAAERARRQLAFEPAAALIERVLATAVTGLQRFELVRLLAEVRLLTGDDARGRERALDAMALARALATPELVARAALTYGLSYSFGFTDRVLVGLLEEANAVLPPGDSPLRARLLARLAAALTPARIAAVPIDIARDAVAMARRLGDDRTRLDVIYAAISALIPFARPLERRALSLEALELAERLGEPLVALRSHLRLAFDHFELGELVGVDTHHRAYDELAARLRLPRAQWPSAMLRAMRALLHGRWAEHAAAIADARRLAADAGDTFLEKYTLVGHWMIAARVRGDDDHLARERSAFTTFASIPNQTSYPELTAMVQVRLGELDAARATLAREPVAELVVGHDLPQLGCVMAEVTWVLGDRAPASVLYPWLSADDPPLAALHLHGFAIDRPTAHSAMQLAALLGDLAAARRHYVHALQIVRAVDARPLEAWLHLDFATILIDGGDRGDEPRELLASARVLAEAVQLKIAGRIAAAEARLATPQATGDVRLRCEGEYWAVEGLGTACRLKATRGIELLARLVDEPNRELHVLDLAGAELVDAGDAGELLDRQARGAYRVRMGELREAIEQAEQWNDSARAERARDELEALQAELVRSAGLGGRERRAGRAAERARINIQRRLADAIRRIGEVNAELGRHFAASVRTGLYCSYAPGRAAR